MRGAMQVGALRALFEAGLKPGATLQNRYLIQSVVGVGGMGSVYLAENVGIGQRGARHQQHLQPVGRRGQQHARP